MLETRALGYLLGEYAKYFFSLNYYQRVPFHAWAGSCRSIKEAFTCSSFALLIMLVKQPNISHAAVRAVLQGGAFEGAIQVYCFFSPQSIQYLASIDLLLLLVNSVFNYQLRKPYFQHHFMALQSFKCRQDAFTFASACNGNYSEPQLYPNHLNTFGANIWWTLRMIVENNLLYSTKIRKWSKNAKLVPMHFGLKCRILTTTDLVYHCK